MANPYTSVTISGYNASPPSDDGTVADSNKVNWSKHKNKLGDPLKTLAEGIDTNVLAAFGKRFGNTITTFAGDHTLVAADEGKILSFTGTRTLTLLAAATATNGFNSIVHNAGTGTITIAADGSETIDGSATLIINNQYDTIMLVPDGSNWSTISKPQVSLNTGEIKMWPTGTPPSGWLDCTGSAVSRSTYSALFAVIGTTFGVGDGSTTFNLPDFRGRIPIGEGLGDAASATNFNLADKNGDEVHTLTTGEMPSHAHTTGSATTDSTGGFTARDTSSGANATDATGGGGSHNNLQPSLCIHFIIKT